MLASQFAQPGESIEDVIIRYLCDHDAEPAYLYLEGRVLTEENTDIAIEWAKNKLGSMKLWGKIPLPLGVAWRIIDAMLPEKLLEMIRDIMIKRGLISERRLNEANPFLRH